MKYHSSKVFLGRLFQPVAFLKKDRLRVEIARSDNPKRFNETTGHFVQDAFTDGLEAIRLCVLSHLREHQGVDCHFDMPHVADLGGPDSNQQSDAAYDGISNRDVLRQVLLHIYRFSLSDHADPRVIEVEIKRHAERLLCLRSASHRSVDDGTLEVELSRTRLGLVDSSTAELIHHSYHYLGSCRADGIHLGLYDDEQGARARLLSMVTLSPFDLRHLADALPLGLFQEQVLVLARLFAFDWCPHNTISYTLGRVFSWLTERLPHVKVLITYLNPNLGFRGTVYKATNWVPFGREHKRRYLYLDSNYVTDRQMIETYGTADLQKLHGALGDRIAGSLMRLEPLEIYAYFLDPLMRQVHRKGFDYDFQPPARLVGVQDDSLVHQLHQR